MRFLFVDRIVCSSPAQFIRGIKHVTTDDSFLSVDAEGQPCFIPSLVGEALGQLAAWNVIAYSGFTLRPVAGIVASARMHRSAYVGETLLLEASIDHLDDKAVQYSAVARVGNELVFSIDGALGPLLPMVDFIDVGKVKEQYAEINNPGDWSVISREHRTATNRANLMMHVPLPIDSMTFDSICSSQTGVSLVAEKRIHESAPYFPDHFPKKPVLPMTVLLECKLHLAREFIKRAAYPVNYNLKELRKIKMNEFVPPGKVLTCHLSVKKQTAEELILSYRSEVAAKRVCVVDVVFVSRGG